MVDMNKHEYTFDADTQSDLYKEDMNIDTMPEHDMDIALTMYADHIRGDYAKWSSNSEVSLYRDISFDRGRKFIKVVSVDETQRSVHSFICIKAHDKWKVGDILKAATWAQPAKNFVRGNVLDVDSYKAVRWTGV